ncbi:MAG TPA: sugar phosphate isomerase/epimerase [Spirochaetia bacterium]|nr:sugar phosphate isomerase/epimerase [Spirochaetia bacterium]
MTQKIGLNMYSLRELCGDLDGLQRTFDKVAGAGYRYVQVSGIRDIDPEDITKAFQSSGLKACATHLSWDRFTEDVSGVIDLHKLYGTIHTAIGSLPKEYHGADGVSRFLSEARSILPEVTSAGMDFSYHNHSHEFARFGGSTWIDQLFEQGSGMGVKFELDTYWVAAGGADPAEYIERFSEYMSIVHVKDMAVTPEREQRFAPVGSGNLNWRRIFDAIRNAPIEFVIVEQDAHYGGDHIEHVAASFAFLNENGFAAE